MMALPSSQRGVALLVALLVVALAVLLISGLLDKGELTLARARNTLRSEQADAYADGLEAYAAQVLIKDSGENPGLDTHSDIWATPLPPQPVPGGVISAQMDDLNGCFNLNNLLFDEEHIWFTRLQNLLTALQLDPALADAIIDWVDMDAESHGNFGAEDANYLAQTMPYRAANRTFVHISELRLVRGITGSNYARLAPHICALPIATSVNLNTASVPVLMSLDPNITRAMAERLWQTGQARWTGVSQFVAALKPQGVDLKEIRGLSVDSSYFLLRGDIVVDDVPLIYRSVIERRQGFGTRVLMRYRGSDVML